MVPLKGKHYVSSGKHIKYVQGQQHGQWFFQEITLNIFWKIIMALRLVLWVIYFKRLSISESYLPQKVIYFRGLSTSEVTFRRNVEESLTDATVLRISVIRWYRIGWCSRIYYKYSPFPKITSDFSAVADWSC